MHIDCECELSNLLRYLININKSLFCKVQGNKLSTVEVYENKKKLYFVFIQIHTIVHGAQINTVERNYKFEGRGVASQCIPFFIHGLSLPTSMHMALPWGCTAMHWWLASVHDSFE